MATFTYDIPAPEPGDYDIRLHFAEIFFGVGTNTGGVGSRVFDVSIEGVTVLDNFDILSETQPATALIKEFRDVAVNDGFATISFTAVTNSPKVSAIELLRPGTLPSDANIKILSPSEGWDVNQPFEVSFSVENWAIGEMGSGMTHVHYTVDNDQNTLAPHYSYDPIVFDNLSLGMHTIRVELYNANHTPTGIFDEVMVNVTDQQVCNDTDFPDQWQVRYLEDETTQLAWRSVYILPHDDLDGDGLKDIVTGAWWYKNPGTASGDWIKNTIGAPFNNVAYVYDFDNDGDMDLLGTQGDYEGSDMAWAENDGTGNFTVRLNIPSGDEDYSEPFLAGIAPGPFTNNGLHQMAINWNGAENTGNIKVQLLTVPADPVNTQWSFVNIGPDSAGEDIRSGDIDGDGDLDLFQGVNWLRNEGNGTWTEFDTGISYITTPDRSQLADFDGDGRLDAVVGQLSLGSSSPARLEFSWFKAPSDPTQPWERNVLATDINGSLSVFAVDMDMDGDQDIIVGEWKGSNRLIAFENDLCASGTWIKQELDAGGNGIDHHDSAQVTDIDNDGDLDVVSVGWDNRIARIYENTTVIDTQDGIAPVLETLGLQIYNLASEVNLQIVATDSNIDDTLMFMASGLPDGLSIDMASGAITGTLTAIAGEYEVEVVVTDSSNLTDTTSFTMVVGEFSTLLRINAGGPLVAFNAENWIADEFFENGATFNSTTAIANTLNDAIFQTERNSGSGSSNAELVYNIPVPQNGVYGIRLYFSEIFHTTNGARIFDVDIENGQGQLVNYDIFAKAGANTATSESFVVDVQDELLTLVFSNIIDRAKITAIELLGDSSNSEPVVDAGDDQQLLLPNTSTTITGVAYDPDGGIVQYLWEQLAGPEQATLLNIDEAQLSVNDLIDGTYNFRLTVTDDEGQTNSDEVLVEVIEPVSDVVNINAGGSSFVFRDKEWSADQYFIDGEAFSASIEIANTENDLLYETERYDTDGTLIYEIPLLPGEYSLDLHFAEIFFGVGNNPGGIGSRVFNIDVENGQGIASNYDIIERAGGPAAAIVESFTNISVEDGNLTITLTAVTGDPKISGISVSQIPNSTPTVAVGEDIDLTLPEDTTVITGTASDADGTIATYEWTQVEGPSVAVLNGETTSDVTISTLIEGSYIFRLTVTDNDGATAFDEVTVNVLSATNNEIPTVSVGEDINLTLPEDTTLITGTASDADGTIATYEWTQVEGPSVAVLNGETTSDVTVSTLIEGSYIFRLTVTDNDGATAFDEVTVNVLSATNNEIPTVSVGEDIDLTLPEDTTLITGTASDADGTIATYEWTQVEGPSVAVLNGETTSDVTISTLIEGSYIFRLTVTDNDGATAFDEVTVNVLSATNNEIPTVSVGEDIDLTLPEDTTLITGTASDTDGTIETYAWTQVDGPSTALLSNDTTMEVTVSNLVEGTYIFRLTVTDDTGDVGFDEVLVNVSPLVVNQAPIAAASASVLEGNAPLEIEFSSSNSTDDSTIVSYLWDFGTGDISTLENPTYIFELPGTFEVTLTVVDEEGLEDSSVITILINDNIPLENPEENSLIIAPNPAVNSTEVVLDLVENNDILGIYIYDLSGRLSQSYNLMELNMDNGSYTINTAILNDGIYSVYVFIANEAKPLVTKLLVKH